MEKAVLVIQHTVAEWTSSPNFILYVSEILAIGGVISFLLGNWRANRRFNRLMLGFNTVTAKLNEAEKFGHFGSFTWDFQGGFNFWSEEMFALFGLISRQNAPTIDKVIAMTHEKDRKVAEESWERAQAQPGDFTIPAFRVVLSTGEIRYLRIQGSTTLGPDKKPQRIQGIAHDITKEMEVDRAKTEFVSLASHQLKTPLTAVGWLAEGLITGDKGALTPEQQTYVQSIHETNRQMIAIVNDLLNVSRIELNVLDVRPEDLNIVEFAKSMVDGLRHSAREKNVTINEKYEEGLPQVMADKNLLRMIFQNLLTNAIKYTLPGGSVELEVSHGSDNGKTFIRVADSGIGIPKAAREHIFEKLYRADNAQKTVVDGTGLGLYIIKTIIERVHGGITFDSIEGKGTTFYVTLPNVWIRSEK
jgi:signal transduction histidine kinase